MGHRRFVDRHGLEAALEGRVLFKVLAVFVQGRRTDGLKFPASKHWFEDAGRVDRAFRCTRANERVNFVDEDDDVAAIADFLGDLLEAFFEVTAVAASGDKAAEVERVDLFVLERLRNLALDDRLCEALDDGGLADAGLTDQNRVVLGATGKDLHDAFHFLLAPDDGVEFPVARRLREVAAVLVENRRALVRRRRFCAADDRGFLALVTREQLNDGLANAS
ncbi:unannotated protein [freshwater metagenome]|uniref:Unannotated protein n=1 Tax=freshwater metagenome TaxID=449393 RepID=A0A6J6FMG3_9ZZZZ